MEQRNVSISTRHRPAPVPVIETNNSPAELVLAWIDHVQFTVAFAVGSDFSFGIWLAERTPYEVC
jgi:hypothetical protein